MTADIAIIATTLTSLASTWALVYTVRRVSPWPKPPAPPAAPQSRQAPAESLTPAGDTS